MAIPTLSLPLGVYLPAWLSFDSEVVAHIIRIALILLGAYVLNRILKALFPKVRAHIMRQMANLRGTDTEMEKRATTLSALVRKTVGIIVWIVAVMMALREAGFDVAPILAGAGVAGVAVGFGAQSLVKDVISGAFILLENQIRVNDVAIINGTGGLVEQINLRTTVLRGLDGTVHIFPNGEISTLANMTHGYSYYVFDMGVAYKEDTDRVAEVLKGVADEMMKEEKYASLIISPLEILGVDKFADSAVIVKARIKTVPVQQWTVGREMNRRIKKKFDELGIEIPFPHMSLYFGEASKPVRLSLDGMDRSELKALIREAINEREAEQAAKSGTRGDGA